MADTGLPRFISLLVYKLYKACGRRRTPTNGLRGQLYAESDVLPNDARQHWRSPRPTRRADPNGASAPHANRPGVVSRLAGARPRAPRPDVADDPRDVCEGASGSDGVRGERPRRGALVRRGPGGEGARHHGPRSIREDPRWSLMVTRGPLGRRGDWVGPERRAGLRADREDGPSGPRSVLGGPTMDALDERVAPTRIDGRDGNDPGKTAPSLLRASPDETRRASGRRAGHDRRLGGRGSPRDRQPWGRAPRAVCQRPQRRLHETDGPEPRGQGNKSDRAARWRTELGSGRRHACNEPRDPESERHRGRRCRGGELESLRNRGLLRDDGASAQLDRREHDERGPARRADVWADVHLGDEPDQPRGTRDEGEGVRPRHGHGHGSARESRGV